MLQMQPKRQAKYREKQLQKYGKEVIKEKESKSRKEKRRANIELVCKKTEQENEEVDKMQQQNCF